MSISPHCGFALTSGYAIIYCLLLDVPINHFVLGLFPVVGLNYTHDSIIRLARLPGASKTPHRASKSH